MLQAGLAQNNVARQYGNTRDRQLSGRTRVTSRQQDNPIRLVHQLRSIPDVKSHCRKHPDYDQSALEQSVIDIVTSGHYVQQSVQFCF